MAPELKAKLEQQAIAYNNGAPGIGINGQGEFISGVNTNTDAIYDAGVAPNNAKLQARFDAGDALVAKTYEGGFVVSGKIDQARDFKPYGSVTNSGWEKGKLADVNASDPMQVDFAKSYNKDNGIGITNDGKFTGIGTRIDIKGDENIDIADLDRRFKANDPAVGKNINGNQYVVQGPFKRYTSYSTASTFIDSASVKKGPKLS